MSYILKMLKTKGDKTLFGLSGNHRWHKHKGRSVCIHCACQWLRICVPVRGNGFNPWSGKIPRAACETTEAHALEPVLRNKKSVAAKRNLHIVTRE